MMNGFKVLVSMASLGVLFWAVTVVTKERPPKPPPELFAPPTLIEKPKEEPQTAKPDAQRRVVGKKKGARGTYASETGGKPFVAGKPKKRPKPPPRVKSRIQVEMPEKAPETTLEVEPDHWLLSNDDQKFVQDSYEDILKREMRVQRRFNRHLGRHELTLDRAAQDPRLAQYGFRPGDVLVSINGEVIQSEAEAALYFRSHPNVNRYTIAFRRLGKVHTKTFSAPRGGGF